MIHVEQLLAEMMEVANPKIAEHSARFFKSGPGEYGEGDKFFGIRVPVIRDLVKRYKTLSEQEVLSLIYHDYHEARLAGVLLLVLQYEKSKQTEQKNRIVELYLEHSKQINNWDLVDSSAHKILGPHLLQQDKTILFELANSDNLWQRRIAIITTFYFIRRGDLKTTQLLCNQLLDDKEDLIHKATGWMLREVGKQDLPTLLNYLDTNCTKMARTALRYAIEKLPNEQRQDYLTRS